MKTQLPFVTDETFDQEVLASPIPVLLDFGADWCGPCRALEPALEKLAERHAGAVRVLRIDADVSAKTAARYRVRGLPTLISFVGGKEHKRHLGATSLERLLELFS